MLLLVKTRMHLCIVIAISSLSSLSYECGYDFQCLVVGVYSLRRHCGLGGYLALLQSDTKEAVCYGIKVPVANDGLDRI